MIGFVSRVALPAAIVAAMVTTHPAQAQGTGAKAHPPVCAEGVRVYQNKNDIKTPFDTVALPPAPPVRVTNAEEARAAELALRESAGSVGANALLITMEPVDMPDGTRRMRRNVEAMFIPAETERSTTACKK